MNRRQSKFGLSLRDILAGVTIIALLVAFFLGRTESQRLRSKLEKLSPNPHIDLYQDDPTRTVWANTASIAISGTLYPVGYEFSGNPTITCKMKSISDNVIVAAGTGAELTPGGGFGINLKYLKNSPPESGWYVVSVEILDGNSIVATEWSAMRVTAN